MAKQLNLLATGQVIPTALHAEMQRSYLEYAMSVIVGRALPDVRDGLKPVHRRILYAMHELGLTPDRPYRKCARVVGDVLGKYHPHGDQAVYDALVRLVQEFSSRYPLLAGHGNFGSVDNDPPAAMRYTETRLSPLSHEAMLSEISDATVDFIDNFDSSQQEPIVLPAQLPILLLNGCSGIAVGMATNIPPHNLGEIVDGLIALIDRPDLPDEKLWQLIPGPDFPTGGEIVEIQGIREAYSTSRGSIPMRGVVNIEEVQGGRGRHRRQAIIVTELPYQVNKAGWIEKMADLVNQGRLEGIADLRDESDREGMRVVIELKRDFQPRSVLKQLYKQTALQTNFGAIMLALVDGQPRQLTLRQLLEEFLRFREQTLTRQYNDELQQDEKRRHLVAGMLTCLGQVDAVIDILKAAPDGTTAKVSLQERLDLSEIQADAILAMPLRRITGLERQKLQTEFDELTVQIEALQRLLGDRQELLKALKKDLRSLKRKYSDRRRTKILTKSARSNRDAKTQDSPSKPQDAQQKPQDLLLEEPTPEAEPVLLEFTYKGAVQRQRPTSDKAPNSFRKKGDGIVVETQLTQTDQELILITVTGKAYSVKVQDIPPMIGRKSGVPLANLLPESAQPDTVVTHFLLPDAPEKRDLILLSQNGKIKRLSASELTNLTSRGLTLIKLKEDDQLQYVSLAEAGENIVIATSNGRLLRFEINDEQLPIMGRTAQGNQVSRLRRREQIVGCVTLKTADDLLLVTQQGYGKRLPVAGIRQANRGDLGTQALQFKTTADTLKAMLLAQPKTEIILATSTEQMVHVPMKSVKLLNKDGAGSQLVKLKAGETIVKVTVVTEENS
jgi:DNA gyrase subunit A